MPKRKLIKAELHGRTVWDLLSESFSFTYDDIAFHDRLMLESIPLGSTCADDCRLVIDAGFALYQNAKRNNGGSDGLERMLAKVTIALCVMRITLAEQSPSC